MFRKIFLHSPVRYIVGIIIAVIIFIICLLSKGVKYSISFVDAFQVSGGVVFFLGLLQCVSFYGSFELFGYAFSGFRGRERRYKDYYEYRKAKELSRNQSKLTYVPFIVVGLFFFAIGLILNSVLL